MKNIILLFLITTIPVLGNSQVEELYLSIDSLFSNVDEKTPGYHFAVIRNGEYLVEKGYGLANLEHNIEINKNTNFNIASLSKQFTAAAIALLIIDNKVSLEDEVSKYLVDFPFTEDKVKIKHLIYMTSGINDYQYNDRSNGTDWSSLNYFNIDTAIQASYHSGELMYKPGTQWSYSNINYILLTKVVETVSGKQFSQFVSDEIFKPLKMNSSYVNDDIFQVIPNRALGYNFRDEENTNWLLESNYINRRGNGFLQINRNSPHYGGSGIYTSMNDFKKWVSNFQSKEFGGEVFYKLMHKTMKFEHDKSNDAFGLVIDKYEGKNIVWYEGGDWGYSSFMISFPDTEMTIVCFSNLGTGNSKSKVWGVYDKLKENKLIE